MSSANLSVAEAAPKRPRKSKAPAKRGRPRSRSGPSSPSNGGEAPPAAAAGTLTRTKALLLAALRVWELKHRIND